MKYGLTSMAVAIALACCGQISAHAQTGYVTSEVGFGNHIWTDNGYRVTQGNHIDFTGVIVRVNEETGRLSVRSDSHRRYNVETYNAEMVTPATGPADISDNIAVGARVRVVGYRYGVGLIDADRVVVLPDDETPAADVAPEPAPVPVVVAPPPVVEPAPEPLPTPSVDTVRLEGVIQLTAPDAQRLEILGDDDNQTYTIKAVDADIILPGVDRAGAFSDFATGMRVRVVGERIDGGVIVADRIKIVPEETDAPVAPVQPAVTDLSVYTGIIIDVRGTNISRSPSPAIYGPDMSLIYPDRGHVPTPDEVQDESIVRYYRSLDAAEAGIGGTHPLVLIAESVVGPAEDSVMLDATGAALFQALDKRLGYSKNWKVGFLVPADK